MKLINSSLALVAVAAMTVLPLAAQAQAPSQNSKHPIPMFGPSGPQPVRNQNSKRPSPLVGPAGAQAAPSQNTKRP